MNPQPPPNVTEISERQLIFLLIHLTVHFVAWQGFKMKLLRGVFLVLSSCPIINRSLI